MATAAIQGNTLWDEAFTEIQASKRWSSFLKIIERKHIEKANDPEAIARILHKIQENAEASRNGRLRLLRKPCLKLLDVLKQLNDLGTTAAALNPYASIAWSGVSFLIQAATNNRDIEQLCWDELPQVFSLVSRYQTFENVYEVDQASTDAQKLLRNALVKLYTGILEYQVEVVVFAGSKMEKFKNAFRDSSQSAVHQALKTIESAQLHVRDMESIVTREFRKENFERLSNGMAEIKAAISDLEMLSTRTWHIPEEVLVYVKGERRDKILNWISPFMHENSHRKAEKSALQGTGQWLLQHQDFEEWYSSSLPTALWLKGFMGSGKSCLTHLVIEHVRESLKQTPSQRLAFFYCDATDQQSNQAMSDSEKIMRNLLKQLAVQEATIHKAVFDAFERLHNSANLTAAECIELMVEVSSQLQSTFIILDGFDECSINVQRTLATHLQDLMQKAQTTIRIFVSGRPSVEPRLTAWVHSEINVRDNNLGDLRYVIQEKVSSAVSNPEFKSLYWKGQNCRVQQVIEILESHAQGMFRWVDLAVGYLHKGQYYDAMTRRLNTLLTLRDLFDLYKEIWKSVMTAADEEDQKVIKVLILFAMYGLEAPWFDQELNSSKPGWSHVAHAAAFAIDPKTKQTDTPTIQLQDLVHLCPDFVEYEETVNDAWPSSTNDWSKLRVPHVSVQEFFVTHHGAEYSPLAGNAFLARLSIQYWLEHMTWAGFGDYSGANWGDHLLQVKTHAGGNLEAYLKQDNDLEEAVTAFLLGPTASEPFTKFSKWMQDNQGYRYLISSHATENWPANPVSTVFARIELGLSVEELADRELLAKQCTGQRFWMTNPMNALEFARKTGNSEAEQYLMAVEAS